MSSRILLADNNPALLEAVVGILKQEHTIVGTFPNGTSLLRCVRDLNPDLIVLDISLGDMTGFDVVRSLKATQYEAKIIMLTVYEGSDFVSAAFDRGVDGYVFKSRISPDLLEAIRVVLAGGQFIPLPSQPFE